MNIGKRIKLKRKEMRVTLEEMAQEVQVSRQTLSRYETGIIQNIPSDKIEIIAKILNTTPAYLMGWDESPNPSAWERYPDSGIMPPPNMVKKPLIGTIACGTPILAVENILGVYDVPDHIKCDFILQCTGDSMIGAHIANGSYVYIREQPMVEQGEIGAVLIDGEATLKRVYYDKSNNILTLNEENPKSPPLVYVGETLENIKIIGKAVGYTTWLE